jgi:hypothetical protein
MTNTPQKTRQTSGHQGVVQRNVTHVFLGAPVIGNAYEQSANCGLWPILREIDDGVARGGTQTQVFNPSSLQGRAIHGEDRGRA